MKKHHFRLFLVTGTAVILLSGCYTLLKHPDVLVEYVEEKNEGAEVYSEEYDVYVDEDCSYCHDSFNVATHFNPLIPAHRTTQSFWNVQPWWFDNRYMMIFGGNGEEEPEVEYRSIPARRGGGSSATPASGNRYIPGRSSPSSGSASVESDGSGGNSTGNDQTGRRVIKSGNEDTKKSSGRSVKKSKRSIKKRK